MKKYSITWNTGFALINLNHEKPEKDNNGNPLMGQAQKEISTLKEASQYFRNLVLMFPSHNLEIVESNK